MKVVINRCFGGFSLSRKAVARLAELQGRQCFFFTNERPGVNGWVPAPPSGSGRDLFWTAFDIPNPNEVLGYSRPWHEMTQEESQAANARYAAHVIDHRPDDRADAALVRVVEELGAEANGACAELAVVEIPDGTDYEIEEYDGNEHIAEKHRTWR